MERYTTFLDWKDQSFRSLLKWPFYPDSMQSLPNYSGIFHKTRTKYGNTKAPEYPKQSWEGRTEVEELCSLTAVYTIHKTTGIKTTVLTQKQTQCLMESG